MKTISECFPDPKSGNMAIIQAKIPADLREKVKSKLKLEGRTWNDLFIAACLAYLSESKKK